MLDLPIPSCLPWQDVTVRDDPFSCYETEFDFLCRTLRRLGAKPSDVEDFAHEVFLVLRERWDTYDPSRPLRPFLFGIAYRVVLKHRRRHREEPTEEVVPNEVEIGPEHQLETEQKRRLVLLALEAIPYERRAVFVMRELDDTPMQDIARTLRIPLFTAYSRLRKARREFEAAVEKLREHWS
jgi:RNA polymerase sigma-70 factor (ECF subfamily)